MSTSIILIGLSGVGQEVIRQVRQLRSQGRNLTLTGLFGPSTYAIDLAGIPLDQWSTMLSTGHRFGLHDSVVYDEIAWMTQRFGSSICVIDTGDNPRAPFRYRSWLDNGAAVISSNPHLARAESSVWTDLRNIEGSQALHRLVRPLVACGQGDLVRRVADPAIFTNTVSSIECVFAHGLHGVLDAMVLSCTPVERAFRDAYDLGWFADKPWEELRYERTVEQLLVLARMLGVEMLPHMVKTQYLFSLQFLSKCRANHVGQLDFFKELAKDDSGEAAGLIRFVRTCRQARRHGRLVAKLLPSPKVASLEVMSVGSDHPAFKLGPTQSVITVNYYFDRAPESFVATGSGIGPTVSAIMEELSARI